MMRRSRSWSLLFAAALAGLVAGLLTAVADGGDGVPSAPRPSVAVPLSTGPLRTSPPGIAAPRAGRDLLPTTYPDREGRGTRIVGSADDPYGGPRWTVRTFTRTVRLPEDRRRIRQTCAQIGRILEGRFVWIDPRRAVARAVPVNTTDTTVCTGRGRGVVLGALRLPSGRLGASNPQIAATVVWGVSPDAGTRVRLTAPDRAIGLPTQGSGVRLVVLRGDLNIGRTTATADGRAVPYGIDNARYERPGFPRVLGSSAAGDSDFGVTAGLRVAAIATDPSADRPRLIVTSSPSGAVPSCYSEVGALVDGSPVRALGAVGALAPDSTGCAGVPDVPDGQWTSLGSGSSSSGSQPSLERRRGREYRTLGGTSSQAWAFPPDVVEADIQDPLGVRTLRTVRVGGASVVLVHRAGDLPVGAGMSFEDDRARIITGRLASGRQVRLRYAAIVNEPPGGRARGPAPKLLPGRTPSPPAAQPSRTVIAPAP